MSGGEVIRPFRQLRAIYLYFEEVGLEPHALARRGRGTALVEAREALALALRLFDLGRTAETRRRFARALRNEPAMKESWFRSLILELKR
jgi:hypothetical protein